MPPLPPPPIKISLRPLTKKFDDLCNSSNISKMAANFKLQVSHSHVSEVSSLNLLKFNLNVADSGPGSAHVFDLCVTLTPFTGLGRPEQLLLYRKPSNWSNKALRYPSDCFCYFHFGLTFYLCPGAIFVTFVVRWVTG